MSRVSTSGPGSCYRLARVWRRPDSLRRARIPTRTTRRTARRRRSSCSSEPGPAARRSAMPSPPSPPTSARSTTTPPASALMLAARAPWSAPTTTSPTPATAGAASPSPSPAAPGRFGIQVGTFGFDNQPVYTVDQPDGTGVGLLGQPDLRRRHLRPELLRPVLRRRHRQVRVRPAGRGHGNAFAVDFGTNFHADAQQPPDPARVRGGQPGHQPQVQRRRARRRRAARSGGSRPQAPAAGAAAAGRAQDQGLPAADRLPGGAGLRPAHRRPEPAHPARPTSTRPTTTAPASPAAASGP